MKICQAVVIALLGLVLAGCRGDPSRDWLERDNFQKELEINRLKGRVEDLQEQLDCVKPPQRSPPGYSRPTSPGGVLVEPGRIENIPPGRATTRPGPALQPGTRPSEEPALPEIRPLNVSPGVETVPGEVPKTLRPSGGAEPGRIPPPSGSSRWTPQTNPEASGRPADVRLVSGAAAIDNQTVVAQITLHPSLTGGIGSGRSGDEGLLVVVEPRDFAGNIVPVAGETSVALIDPAATGEQARLARWDFTVAETERMMHAGAEPGIHLRLPWRSAPPHDRLKVFVRFTTRDGRKLQAERLIAVALGDAGVRDVTPPSRDVGAWSPDRLPNRPEALTRDSAPADPRRSDAAAQRPAWSPDRD